MSEQLEVQVLELTSIVQQLIDDSVTISDLTALVAGLAVDDVIVIKQTGTGITLKATVQDFLDAVDAVNYVERINTDAFIGDRISPKELTDHGFDVTRDLNKKIGLSVHNEDTTGDSAHSELSVGDSSLYGGLGMVYFGSGYSINSMSYMAGKVALYSTKKLYFLDSTDAGFEWRSGATPATMTKTMGLDENGNLDVIGNITAVAFVTIGGLVTQFVMGDGSLFTGYWAFKDVATGLPNGSSLTDAYREGLLGLNEANPEENLDILGSMKLEDLYANGARLRVALGGENILSELGFPANGAKGMNIDLTPSTGSSEETDGMKLQLFMSDVIGLGQAYNLLSGLGFSDNAGTTYNRIQSFKQTGGNGYVTSIQNTFGVLKSHIRNQSLGLVTGQALEALIEFHNENGTEINTTSITPHLTKLGQLIQLATGYGAGTFVEGYTHTDTLAKTGTAPTTIGALAFPIGVDANGNLMAAKRSFAKLTQEHATTVGGGSTVAATWNKRILNTEVDPDSIVTLEVDNTFTLTTGRYRVWGSSVVISPNRARARIYNVTDASTAVLGDSSYGNPPSAPAVKSFVVGIITVVGTKNFRFEHYTEQAFATQGMGVASSDGEPEVYAQLEIEKLN